ncbi:MAG: ATP-binding cassette domain-containing protein [Acidimicrobiia bacterium]
MTGDRTSLFHFDDVSVTSNGARILSELTLDLPTDEITVVVGPSGSGKTTLLRLCNRLSIPSGGQITYLDAPLDDLDPQELRRRVGIVFQQPVLFGGTVRDNLTVADPGATDDQLVDVLDRVHLSSAFLGRAADNLSGGEAQRLCLARTLLTEPETLLMDEPTASVDPELRRGLEEEVLGLADRGVSVVWVTHDHDQMRRLATHVVGLEKGQITYEGPPQEDLGSSHD